MENSINLINDEILIKEYIERGKGLFNDGETQKAFKNFNKAILLNNKYALTYLIKGQAHLELYEVEEAKKCLKTYVELVPKDPKGYWKLIDIHDLTGEFDKCIYYCEKLIINDPQNSIFHIKKAQFLALLNDFKEAIKSFDVCLELDPNFYDALCGKGSALLSLRYKKEAIELYKKAIEVDFTKSDAYFGISQVYMSMGPITEALRYAEKAYHIEPENEWYKCHYNVLKNMNLKI
ncbi:tetratricopeptide repeat protein [Clostridium lacusfryxellense]|uniref:tetratricopeptide repeat protein n=1 Tax=Clostridium lacusfryxellense TaxID=205328 RepID=UPI001C0AA153|nr:tetratricopeptide repeat protein [Clostridium lacusfryxellense]MBU3114374.1 tetratricopeptide repeat protein [Clostridium lacusfryxellense]